MEKSDDYEYNNLREIDHLRHEVITDKTLSYHDSLFKIIIIGDSGNIIGLSSSSQHYIYSFYIENISLT